MIICRVETARDVLHHGSHHRQVQVAVVGDRIDRKIIVSDITPTNDSHGIVDDEGLVVHAVIEPLDAQHKFKGVRHTIREWIEEPDLDVGMNIHYRELEIGVLGGDMVKQHAHSHTTVSRAQEPLRKYAPRGIRLPDIVLHIYGLLRHVRKTNSATETHFARGYKDNPGFTRIGLYFRLEKPA